MLDGVSRGARGSARLQRGATTTRANAICRSGHSSWPTRQFLRGLPMFPMHTKWRNTSRTTTLIGVLLLALSPAAQSASPSAQSAAGNDRDIANSLAAMLRAGRAVISNNAAHINDPTVGDKGLDGKSVLAQVDALYLKTTGVDPLTMDPASRDGRLLRDEMDAIVEVMDANAASINTQGIGFKGFIPAVFGRLVSEAFSRRAAGE